MQFFMLFISYSKAECYFKTCSSLNMQTKKFPTASLALQSPSHHLLPTHSFLGLPVLFCLPFHRCAAKHLEKSDILEVNRPTAVSSCSVFLSLSPFSSHRTLLNFIQNLVSYSCLGYFILVR